MYFYNFQIFAFCDDVTIFTTFKFLHFVMTSQGNNGNFCLLSIYFYLYYWGYPYTKFEVFSISQS